MATPRALAMTPSCISVIMLRADSCNTATLTLRSTRIQGVKKHPALAGLRLILAGKHGYNFDPTDKTDSGESISQNLTTPARAEEHLNSVLSQPHPSVKLDLPRSAGSTARGFEENEGCGPKKEQHHLH